MPSETILYFAYGSNMLSQRLTDRCPSAKAIGVAVVHHHYMSFGLAGRDGSGKAAIVKTHNQDDKVHGVVFELARTELADLDKFEIKYKRNDNFEVVMDGQSHKTITYYVLETKLEIGLLPTDWYRDICLAGAKQHGLDADYIAELEALIVRQDPDNDGHKYLQNLA
ncbi:MAG: gamma-glutamylcyclotransferase [Alphaproteobacteria bacterium]|nr:gamma-glutamylcyclotransferase [Alphaproteobacteria bacterium]